MRYTLCRVEGVPLHFCLYCLQNFSSEKVLNKHKIKCIEVNGTQPIRMPTGYHNILNYNDFQKQLNVPFVISTDFESITLKK